MRIGALRWYEDHEARSRKPRRVAEKAKAHSTLSIGHASHLNNNTYLADELEFLLEVQVGVRRVELQCRRAVTLPCACPVDRSRLWGRRSRHGRKQELKIVDRAVLTLKLDARVGKVSVGRRASQDDVVQG
jgi:hypothetical protein